MNCTLLSIAPKDPAVNPAIPEGFLSTPLARRLLRKTACVQRERVLQHPTYPIVNASEGLVSYIHEDAVIEGIPPCLSSKRN